MALDDAISMKELEQVPYLAKPFPASSIVASLSFFVGGEWHCWLPVGGKLQKMKMWPYEASYFGDRPERGTDQFFPLFDLLAQRTLQPGMTRAKNGLQNDFRGLAASLAKMSLYHREGIGGVEVRWFMQTELEYVLMVARSVFDLLQEVISAHWASIKVAGQRHKRKLPGSFSDVIRQGDRLRTAEEIAEKYSLSPSLADWYSAQAPFFMVLRSLRDKVMHGGALPAETLFVTDRGFAIFRDLKPFSELYQWPVECELPNHLVPLRPVVCRIIQSTRDACDSFAKYLLDNVQLPPEIAPGFRYYSRGEHDCELTLVPKILKDSLWCDACSSPEVIARANAAKSAALHAEK